MKYVVDWNRKEYKFDDIRKARVFCASKLKTRRKDSTLNIYNDDGRYDIKEIVTQKRIVRMDTERYMIKNWYITEDAPAVRFSPSSVFYGSPRYFDPKTGAFIRGPY